MSLQTPVCVVVGVGAGNGAAFARRFTTAGYRVALLSRSGQVTRQLAAELDGARAYDCDVTDAASVERTFGAIRSELGEVDVLIHNPGSGVWGNVEDITPGDFEASWKTNALGGLLVAQQVIPVMKKNRRGSIVFIGATASRRGGAKTAAFAPAKAAQKSLAESMARHLWPAGVHVALVLVDGVIDSPASRKRMPDKPESFFAQPSAIADQVFNLVQQKSSAWTFELEVRPFAEVW
ncbi:MAG: SDR family NAD(P)-dependent oxidoreductase [Betaproteobacteria bacterium]|nr:SDR family NAD(P)-dependent oxidoreductase [Betaproteobacteria bacterium]